MVERNSSELKWDEYIKIDLPLNRLHIHIIEACFNSPVNKQILLARETIQICQPTGGIIQCLTRRTHGDCDFVQQKRDSCDESCLDIWLVRFVTQVQKLMVWRCLHRLKLESPMSKRVPTL